MKDTKLEIQPEGDAKSWKEETNQSKLENKYEAELKIINNKPKEVKIKIIKGDVPLIKVDINKNAFLYYKNISGKKLNYIGKKENIKKYNNNKSNKIYNKRNIYLIIIIFFNLIITNNNMIENKSSSITLKIKGTGYQRILSYEFFYFIYPPNIININGNPKTTNYEYNFYVINNTVNLIWFNPIDNCNFMFSECSNIIGIDFSNFDTSKVTFMDQMFSGCSQLSSLNLFNFNTSSVISMSYMFSGCSLLLSLIYLILLLQMLKICNICFLVVHD